MTTMRSKQSTESKAVDSVLADRFLRQKPAKMTAKFGSVKWDGMSSTFRIFRKALEGHLLQVGAGYLTQPAFMQIYKELKTNFLKSDVFWNLYKVSFAQA